jgi:hypothetical protein
LILYLYWLSALLQSAKRDTFFLSYFDIFNIVFKWPFFLQNYISNYLAHYFISFTISFALLGRIYCLFALTSCQSGNLY